MRLRTLCQLLLCCFLTTVACPAQGEDTELLKAMVLTGQNKHGWEALSARLREALEETTLFDVDVVLATAYSDPKYEAHWGVEKQGTGEHELMLFTVRYGKGRVFGTPMGHVDNGAKVGAPAPAMDCEGFIAIVQRGTEWAATGKVTQKVPKSFPGKDKVNLR